MSNNDDKRLTKPEYFDLRERRLKLVYKILYVVVVIWIAILLIVAQNRLDKSVVPIYSFMLSASSMVIIQIIKYALMEFRCMKVIGHVNEELMKQTEIRYDNIWMSFSLILSLCGLALISHYIFVEIATATLFMYISSICIGYFTIVSFVKMFIQKISDTWIKIVDVVGIIIGSVTAYSLCAASCLITNAL